jgi:hypothetical protein
MGIIPIEFKERSRTRAMAIKNRLREMGFDVGLGQAYEVLAAADGFRNWPTMRSKAENEPSEPEKKTVLSEVDRLVNEFNAFVESRQKQLLPRTRIMVLGGTEADRLSFAKDFAAKVGRDLFSLQGLPELRSTAQISEYYKPFEDAWRNDQVVYIDDVSRLGEISQPSPNWLSIHLDEVPTGQLVILGASRGEPLDRAILRRVQYRHWLD